MRIGFGAVDITPPLGTELGGYGYYLNRRAQRVLDPLMCRAICIEEGGGKYAVVNCDLVQLSGVVCDAAERLIEAMGYPCDHVMLLSIHTHTAPVSGVLEGCGAQDEAYVKSLPGAIVRAVGLAEMDMADVSGVRYADAQVTGIAFNRADVNGPLDEQVRGALFERVCARPVALVSYACHPVTLGRVDLCSADYPGQVVAHLAERGIDAALLNGFCGDVDPASNRIAWGSGTADTIREMGQKIADGFLSGLGPAQPAGAVSARRIPLQMRNQPLDEAVIEREVRGVTERAGEDAPQARVACAWADKMCGALRRGEDLTVEPFEAAALRVGDLVLAAMPYECYTRTGITIREALSGRTVLALGCFRGTLGYLPTADEFACASYAASASAYLYLRPLIRPGEAERLADALSAELVAWR